MREHLKGLIGGVAGAAMALIVVISSGQASVAAACHRVPPTMGNFSRAEKALPAPDVPFADAEGSARRLADFRGTGLVVNFWATWCAPCVKEMPAIDRLAKQLKARDVVVLALSSDREGQSVVRKFYDKNQIGNLPVMVDSMSKVARALGVDGLPTTILFDAEGQEVGRVVGEAEWDAPASVDFLAACLAPTA